jgi:hypothetical protein
MLSISLWAERNRRNGTVALHCSDYLCLLRRRCFFTHLERNSEGTPPVWSHCFSHLSGCGVRTGLGDVSVSAISLLPKVQFVRRSVASGGCASSATSENPAQRAAITSTARDRRPQGGTIRAATPPPPFTKGNSFATVKWHWLQPLGFGPPSATNIRSS